MNYQQVVDYFRLVNGLLERSQTAVGVANDAHFYLDLPWKAEGGRMNVNEYLAAVDPGEAVPTDTIHTLVALVRKAIEQRDGEVHIRAMGELIPDEGVCYQIQRHAVKNYNAELDAILRWRGEDV